MKDDKRGASKHTTPGAESLPNRILGSLRDALNAASRDDRTGEITMGEKTEPLPKTAAPDPHKVVASARQPEGAPMAAPAPKSAAEAVREAKAPPREPLRFEPDEPTTKPASAQPAMLKAAATPPTGEVKTQAVRGKPKVVRTAFHQDPVVGWLVIVGGPGLGSYRPIFEGNNAIGRSKSQRIPLDFGDETISSEEQAYLRYDSVDRSFLFVPNLSKTNIVSVNEKKPTGAVKLEVMDVIGIGRTQLAFVPFCSDEFDWSELAELKE